jgi:hypothetical protein
MVGAAKKHVDELLKLPPEERSEAAEALLLSLEQEYETDDQAAAERAMLDESLAAGEVEADNGSVIREDQLWMRLRDQPCSSR